MTEYPMNKKVFIFDDNIEILELCTEILEDLGLEVKTSPTTNSVEEQVSNYMPESRPSPTGMVWPPTHSALLSV